MLDAQKNLTTGFLILLSLPAAAIGFCLSAGIASTTWLLSTRYGLHIDNIALIWLAGPLMGLLVQPIVGALSDRTWLLNGRRRPYLLVGGIAGAVSMFAMLKLDRIATSTGLSLLVIAVVVALLCDLSTNVTFNPARSLVADLTPEGPDRVRGYSWMQTVSGFFGISAYMISLVLGNEALILITVAVTFAFSVLPMLFIREFAAPDKRLAPPESAAVSREHATGNDAFKALLPMSAFMFYGIFIAVDKLVFDGALADVSVPLFILAVGITLAWGAAIVWRARANPSSELRLRKILLGHGFAWLGVQGMFVMAFFFVRDFVVPNTAPGSVLANAFLRLAHGAEPTAGDTAGNILSLGFLLLNVVGALLPILLLKPLCARWDKVLVHRSAMGLMAVGYLLVSMGANGEIFYYAGMLMCGIGWSSLISIVFAIFSESVNSDEMGVSMGVFNSSLVLPALAVPGLLKLSDALGHHRWMFVLFALCLAVSFAFWCTVSDRTSADGVQQGP
ncbi:MFS transporter [Roseateles sp.]|uniref:MFS transporter n=1 Tax=Roseateles sp. TaxID=1971397 RepID=UPI003D100D3F